MKNIITFTNTLNVPEEYFPISASKKIPDWYKNLESYTGGEKKPDGFGTTTATAKRCMPIFDSISAGYIITTHTDIFVSQEFDAEIGENIPFYQWASFGAIEFHPKRQLPEHPNGDGHKLMYPKWTNSWGIKTPKGYSVLIVPPLHRDNEIIILPGFVDTDKYHAPVNFPFVLKNPKMSGIIPAGTPIAQIIPVKRDSWDAKSGSDKDLKEIDTITNKIKSLFFDSYKRQYRQPKEYK